MYLNRAFKYAEFLFSDTFRSARTPDSPLSLYEGWSGALGRILHHDDQGRHEICPKFYNAGYSGYNFYTVNFTKHKK